MRHHSRRGQIYFSQKYRVSFWIKQYLDKDNIKDPLSSDFFTYGFVFDGIEKAVMMRIKGDLTIEWSIGIDLKIRNEAFIVTADGNYLFFVPESGTHQIYQIDTTNGDILSRIRSDGNFNHNHKLYPHPFGTSIYFELKNSFSGICKWAITSNSFDCYRTGVSFEILTSVPMASDKILTVFPGDTRLVFYLQAIDFGNSGSPLWKKEILCPNAPD
jgi:hypothetical protein